MNLEAEALSEFLSESWELLDILDRELVLLENDSGNMEAFDSIFRVLHTLKGNAGFLAFSGIERLAHSCESALEDTRTGSLSFGPRFMDLLFQAADQFRTHFTRIEKEMDEGERDEGLLESLDRLLASESPDLTIEEPEAFLPVTEERQTLQESTFLESPAEKQEELESDYPAHEIQYARVRVDLLDRLMNLMGELVLCRNELVQVASGLTDGPLLKGTQRLDLVTAELQEKIGQTRMQPLDRLTSKLPRMVRDLAKEMQKEVQLRIYGQDTGLDRTLLEAVRDPLLHLIRNSVDHGLEPPGERLSAGKPAVGNIIVRACHEGGQVKIEVSDDGRGVDLQRLREKAVAHKVLSAEQAQTIPEKELVKLVFTPGLSTSGSVTKLSGRGVGMDVVRASIEDIGGTVDIASDTGKGTVTTLRIPLTLAIIPALMVEVAGRTYAIPQINLEEIVHPEPHLLSRVHGTEVYRLRGKLIPLLRLRRLFGSRESGEDSNIVVVQVDGRPFGLIVDSRCDTAEIVVKPLPAELKDLPYYAGATITGQGDVALILDVGGLAKTKGLLLNQDNSADKVEREQLEALKQSQSLLLFKLGDNELFGISLGLVSRLEEFRSSEVRRTAGCQAVEYRGRLLPLICLASALGREPSPNPSIQALVLSDGERRLGIVVGDIVDIAEEVFEVDSAMGNDTGILGSAIVRGEAVTILDVWGLLLRVYPQWLKRTNHRPGEMSSSRVLLAHESDFFRSITRSHLESEGYEVLEARRKNEAYELLARERVDSVVVDLNMDGSNELLLHASAEHSAVGVGATLEERELVPPVGVSMLGDYDREQLIAALRTSREEVEGSL